MTSIWKCDGCEKVLSTDEEMHKHIHINGCVMTPSIRHDDGRIQTTMRENGYFQFCSAGCFDLWIRRKEVK